MFSYSYRIYYIYIIGYTRTFTKYNNWVHITLYIYRQAESLDHHFWLPINIFLKSLKLGKILKIYYAKLVYYLMINIYIQCCVYAITLHTYLINTHTHIYI